MTLVVGFCQKWGFPKLGEPFEGSQCQDDGIWGSILRSPILGNYQILSNFRPQATRKGNFTLMSTYLLVLSRERGNIIPT